MNLWDQTLPEELFLPAEAEFLKMVAARYPTVPALEQMWGMLDEVWDQLGASQEDPESAAVQAFYRHPVWLVNGIFSVVDPVSQAHRVALGRFICEQDLWPVVDFGGGYGALARQIASGRPDAAIEIVDPYPSRLARDRNDKFPGIKYVPALAQGAGVVVAQDVVEHVSDPVGLVRELVRAARVSGILIFANCFDPCIKCHLPETFHLKRTFKLLMRLFGCRFIGKVPGCEHALIFRRETEKEPSPGALRWFNAYSHSRARLRSAFKSLIGRR